MLSGAVLAERRAAGGPACPATGSAGLAAACSAPADLRHKGTVVERQAEGWWAVDDRQVINDVVFGEPVDGIFTGRARATDAQIIEKLRARGCDAVALAAPRSPGSSTLSHR
jgi:hypothetical protein